MATKIAQEFSKTAGAASRIALAHRGGEALTAVRSGSGALLLIGWRVGSALERTVDSGSAAGEARETALVFMGPRGERAVTAVRSASGKLLLISWETPAGLARITRVTDSAGAAGAADLVEAVAVDASTLLTAVRDGGGRLLLISWRLNVDGSFTRLADSGTQAGAVGLVAMVSFGDPGRLVVTAVKTANRTLKIIPWSVSAAGAIERRRGEGEAPGQVADIAAARLLDEDRRPIGIVTATETAGGTLQVTAWTVGLDGLSVEQRGSASAGRASHLAVAGVGAPSGFVVALRNGSGDLMLIPFEVGRNGSVTRTGEGVTRSGDMQETSIVGFPDGRAITASRLHDHLVVHQWNVLPDPAGRGVLELADDDALQREA
jgi:hypothetical protein